MRRICLLCICMMCMLCISGGARNRAMKDVFINMPDSLMPMIGENARKDLVDFVEYKMKAVVDNEWGGHTTLSSLSASCLTLQEDAQGSVTTQMGLLVKGADTLICMVRTLNVPQPDSEILFYTMDWKPLNADKFFSFPRLKDFTLGTASYTAVGSPEYMQITILEQAAGPLKLQVSLRLDDNIADESAVSRPADVPTLNYQWSGTKFTLIQ